MENELNKWIKQKCAHFTMIPFGLEDLGEMTEVSKFKKGEDIITQYMIESDHSYIFAEIDEGETTCSPVFQMRLFVRLIILLGRKRA